MPVPFAPVIETLEAFADADPGYSAQLAVYHRGELVIDTAVGPGLAPDALLPVFSSSKGAAAMVVALLVQRGQLDLDAPVASYWPEFAQAGKAAVSVRQLLSHQAGLVGVDGGYSVEDLVEHTRLAERLAAQRPYWEPGSGFLYHSLMIGPLADELVRRVDGRPLRQVLAEDVTGPRGVDAWLGLPPDEEHRVAEVLFPTPEEVSAHLRDLPNPPDAALAARSAPREGAVAVLGAVNTLAFRQAGVPAAGLLASARGLAHLYAAARHDVGGPRLLDDRTLAAMAETQVCGAELATGWDASFAVLFQKPFFPRWPFGSPAAFGHDGAGGSLAFCDPEHDLAFGYTVQRVPLPAGMDRRAVRLSEVVRACL